MVIRTHAEPRWRRRGTRVAALALVLAFTGCASDDDSLPTTSTATNSATTPATTPAATTVAATTTPPATSDASSPPSTPTSTSTAPIPPTRRTTTTTEAPSVEPNELGLTAVVDQFREDEAAHRLQIRVSNGGSVKVRLTSVQLDWAGMTPVAPIPRSDLLAPGQVLDVPIPFGVAVCAEDPPGVDEQMPAAPAFAQATVLVADAGAPVPSAIPIADKLHVLARVFPLSCREQRVTDAADISFGPTWTPVTRDGKPGLAGTIVVERANGSGSVVLTRLDGSVLLTVHSDRDGEEAVLTLAPGANRAELPVVIVESGNCLPHALAESKKTFILPVLVSLDGEPALSYDLSLDESVRTLFGELINESCAVGSG